MFQNLRWRLLLSYLMVMAAILSVFGTGVYVFFIHSLYQELDKKLRTLAEAAVPSFADMAQPDREGRTLEQQYSPTGRDLLEQERQSLEWFDAEGQLLESKGNLTLELPPTPGFVTLKGIQKATHIRTYTIPVTEATSSPPVPLQGYIRVSQSTENIERIRNQLLWGLGMGGITTLGLVGLTGFWLTQKALAPIELSFQTLKQFTADASHELRGPLTAIKASLDVMGNHPERIHPKDAKKLAAITSATSQMIHLTEDLLFLARTDTARLTDEGEEKPLALHQILQDLVELFDPLAQSKGITLNYQQQVLVSIIGNQTQLTRLFSNLLRNGLQYTPAGGKVTLSLEKSHRFVLVNVKDTGIGIDRAELPFIFDRFWRADKARSRREGGTGLGLAIAQAIAQRHGGKIEVNSRVGIGTCFTVYLPMSFTLSSTSNPNSKNKIFLSS